MTKCIVFCTAIIPWHIKALSAWRICKTAPLPFLTTMYFWKATKPTEWQPQRLDHEFEKNYYSFTDRASIKKAVSKGLAYATLPRLMAYDDIYVSSGMIIPVPLSDADVALTTYIAYSSKNTLSNAASLTIELVQQLYQKISQKMAAEDRKIEQEINTKKKNQYLVY